MKTKQARREIVTFRPDPDLADWLDTVNYTTTKTDIICRALTEYRMSRHFTDIVEDMPLEEALALFEKGCNVVTNGVGETLWLTESWWAPRRKEFRVYGPNPITAEFAEGLRSVGMEENRLDDLIDYVKAVPHALPWSAFAAERNKKREEEVLAERRDMESQQALAAMAQRPDVVGVMVPTRIGFGADVVAKDSTCPRCEESGYSIPFDAISGTRHLLVICPVCRMLLEVVTPDSEGIPMKPSNVSNASNKRSEPPAARIRKPYFKKCLDWGRERGLVPGSVYKEGRVPYISIPTGPTNLFYFADCDQAGKLNVGLMVQFKQTPTWKPIIHDGRPKLEALRMTDELVDECDFPKKSDGWRIRLSRVGFDMENAADHERQFEWIFDALGRVRKVFDEIVWRHRS